MSPLSHEPWSQDQERGPALQREGRRDLVTDRGRVEAEPHFFRIVASEWNISSVSPPGLGNGCIITAIFQTSDRVTSFHTSHIHNPPNIVCSRAECVSENLDKKKMKTAS